MNMLELRFAFSLWDKTNNSFISSKFNFLNKKKHKSEKRFVARHKKKRIKTV